MFAGLALLYGAILAIATFALKMPMFGVLQSNNALGITFLIAGVFFLPFVVTSTRLGLNTAEGQDPSTETKRRLARLSKACPMWPITWYGSLGFIIVSWVAFAIMGDAVHPFFAFSAAMSLASGLWFAFVYPTATRLFRNRA